MKTFYCPTRRQVRLYKNRAKSDYAAAAHGNVNGIATRTRNGRAPNMLSVTDGTSNTLMAAESRLHLLYMNQNKPGNWSDNEDCYTNGWADEVVRRGDGNRRPRPDETEAYSNDDSRFGQINNRFGGSHQAGTQAVLADGSVRSVSFNVTHAVFRNLCRVNDGNVISSDDY